MRLWHKDLISLLPRQQLLGQHRECCALRGKGWGRKHATVDYVFKHSYAMLFDYHYDVMIEMKKKGYKVNSLWFNACYRGIALGYDISSFTKLELHQEYPEHNQAYLIECLNNLKGKGIYFI